MLTFNSYQPQTSLVNRLVIRVGAEYARLHLCEREVLFTSDAALKAVTATARKIAALFYSALRFGITVSGA